MSNLYNDEEQEQRYARLRDLKKKCETQYGILWIVTALADVFYLGMFLRNSGDGIGSYVFIFFGILSVVLQALGIYNKAANYTLFSFAAMAVSYVAGFPVMWEEAVAVYAFSVLPAAGANIFALRVHKQWAYLEEQEGFPLFKTDRNQTQQRAKKAEQITKFRAVEEGTRAEAAPGADGMQDLLDTGAQAAAAELTGYHDRSRHVTAVQSQKKISSGDMDEL